MSPTDFGGTVPLPWVDKIFRRMTIRFGSRFLEQWRSGEMVPSARLSGQLVDSGVESAKWGWAEELALAGLQPDDITRALQVRYAYPPCCEDFVSASRCLSAASADEEVLFHRAVFELRKRRAFEPQRWPFPGLFWAAASIGDDLLSMDYKWLRGRWRVALDACRGRADAVPDIDRSRAIAAPVWTYDDSERAKRRLQEFGMPVRRSPAGGSLNVDWAMRVADQVGRNVYQGGMAGAVMAAEALKNARRPVPESLAGFLR